VLNDISIYYSMRRELHVVINGSDHDQCELARNAWDRIFIGFGDMFPEDARRIALIRAE